MPEFFVVTNSFAAPFTSDQSTHFVRAETPEAALEAVARDYAHPMGLYAAECYADANTYHKRGEALATWLCNHEQEKRRLTAGRGGYSYLSHAPGDFEIDGVRHTVPDPKGGSVAADA